MATTIFGILSNYGFETRSDSTMWWGYGTIVSGRLAYVRHLGNDLYEVKYHEWWYNQDMDPVKDEETVQVLYGALLLQFLFERLPLRAR